MREYCKAYHLGDLRRFPGWRETPPPETELTDETVVYLWDDLTVAISPVVPEAGTLWHSVDPEWTRFCRENLEFDAPEEELT